VSSHYVLKSKEARFSCVRRIECIGVVLHTTTSDLLEVRWTDLMRYFMSPRAGGCCSYASVQMLGKLFMLLQRLQSFVCEPGHVRID
jgi:hypothetical protein